MAKYLVKDLPYPYTSKAQLERSMETPLGTEWNTRVAFQRGMLSKVVKKVGGSFCSTMMPCAERFLRKMGTVIDPPEKLF